MKDQAGAPLIISASRRTDIPNHYAAWFMQRIRERSVLVRNVRDFHQIQKVDLSPEAVACIVFWTKNPAPLIPYLNELSAYPYYFLYTINAYGQDIEPKSPPMGGIHRQVPETRRHIGTRSHDMAVRSHSYQ